MSEFVFVCFRIDYSNDAEWSIVKSEFINVDADDLDFKEGSIYENKSIPQLLNMGPTEYFFIADNRTMVDHTLILVDYETQHTVRFHARDAWKAICSLPIGNMEFEEFEDMAENGVYDK
jgi:hypothetical protein